MLVLTRRIGESILIGDDITLTVVRIQGDRIRLGIEAPPAVPVHRDEVQARPRTLPALPETVNGIAKSPSEIPHSRGQIGNLAK